MSLLLIPLMHPGSRILFTATGHHDPERKEFMTRMLNNDAILDPDLFNKLDGKQNYTAMSYYKISKLAVIWITYVLAKQYPDIAVLTACPGFVPETNLGRDMPWIMQMILKNVMPYVIPNAVTAHQSALEYMYYTTSDKLEGVTATYFSYGESRRSSKRSYNMEEANKFWNLCCEICNTPEHVVVI